MVRGPLRTKRATQTANLQSRLTIRQAVKLMNVSERSVYAARRLLRTGRADLITAVEQGHMSLHAALREAERGNGALPRSRGHLDKLLAAFERCSEAERAEFLGTVAPKVSIPAVPANLEDHTRMFRS